MRSMYRRQLIMMISIIALSFTMLSTAFMLLSYRYMSQDERDDAARNVGYIANFTTSYLQQNTSIQTDFYRNYIASIALIADSKTPIIMLTAKGEVQDKVTGLEQGADDYVVKPFEMKELIARINAVLRRTEIPVDTSKRLEFDKLSIDLDAYLLVVDGKKIDTPPKELELLYHLASTPNRVYTRNQLLDEVWGFDYFGDSRTVDVHIKRLREKVENISDRWALKTVWGVGYKFEVVGGERAE